MAPSSALADDDMKFFITWEIVNMCPLHLRIGSSSARKTWDPAWLRPLDSLWNSASECATSTISGYVYNTIVRISSQVVEEVVNGLVRAFSGCCMLIPCGIECH